jgi:putative aldouronate transport system permease protein
MSVQTTQLRAHPGTARVKTRQGTLLRRIWRARELYLILIPTLVYFALFHFYPYLIMVIAFKDYSPVQGVWGSPWAGFAHFDKLFGLPEFKRIVVNTLLISLYKLFFAFPIPVIFALLLNEVRVQLFKRTVQTVTYFPHFLSWVVFGGMTLTLLGPDGAVPRIAEKAGLDWSNLLSDPDSYRSLLVVTHILKEFGWNAIIYLAVLASIDPTLYEAARVDGANRWRQMRDVTVPGLMGVMVLVFILDLGHILDAGFEQIFVLYNPAVYSVADIIDTYVYRIGLTIGEFSLATAIGLIKGVVGMILIVSATRIAKRAGWPTLW